MDIVEYRKFFPICTHSVYLNSCSYGALSDQVEASFLTYLKDRHATGSRWNSWIEKLEHTRSLFAQLIGAEGDEIAITNSASSAISSIASSLDFSGPRNKIITTDLAFPTESQSWHALKSSGAEIIHVREDNGEIDLNHLQSLVDDQTMMVAVPFVCYRNGAMTDIPKVSAIARSVGAMVFVDAYQGLGTVPLNMKDLDVDFLVGGALKYLLATAGVGFLYVRSALIEKLHPRQTGWFAQEDIHSMLIHDNIPAHNARRFEQGTPSVPCLYAVEAGLEMILEIGVDAIRQYVLGLNAVLKDGLREMGAKLATPDDPTHHGAMIAVRSTDENTLVAKLEEQKIFTSCRDGNLRISAHFYNNRDDIKVLLSALKSNHNLLL